MGTRIPPPIVVEPADAGDACSVCWGFGKDFGDGDTPDHIVVNFSGIQKADDWREIDGDPLDGIFILDQDENAPCFFLTVVDDVTIFVQYSNGNTEIDAEHFLVGPKFTASIDEECLIFVPNDLTTRFENGSCLIIIPEVE
jgi:hypothetical protein